MKLKKCILIKNSFDYLAKILVTKEIGRRNEISLSKIGQGNELSLQKKHVLGRVDGWMGGNKSCFKYYLQQSTNRKENNKIVPLHDENRCQQDFYLTAVLICCMAR